MGVRRQARPRGPEAEEAVGRRRREGPRQDRRRREVPRELGQRAEEPRVEGDGVGPVPHPAEEVSKRGVVRGAAARVYNIRARADVRAAVAEVLEQVGARPLFERGPVRRGPAQQQGLLAAVLRLEVS